MTLSRRISASLSIAAALAMSASPISAAPLGPLSSGAKARFDQSVTAPTGIGSTSFDHYRRYRHYHHHRHGIDAGDVIAGIAVIGVLAAVASAASQPRRAPRYRDDDDRYDYRYDGRDRYDSPRAERRRSSASGDSIESAVERCLARIERDIRVDAVEEVRREGEGYVVRGALFNGEGFSCRTGADGRVRSVDYGESFASAVRARAPLAEVENNQWDDERYRAAWQRQREAELARADEAAPAYPGAPADGDLDQADGA